MQIKAKSQTVLLSFECSEGKNNKLATINFPHILKQSSAEVTVFSLSLFFLLCLENVNLTDSELVRIKRPVTQEKKTAAYIWSCGDEYEH